MLYSTVIETLTHAPHSPDLAPCNFYSCPKIKKNFEKNGLRTRKEWPHTTRASERPPSAGGQSVPLGGSIEFSDVSISTDTVSKNNNFL
ncbi:hypothetical protein EVAR_92970_1 [Eumeta japonica]|uniref:Histone-lysine N-methyltransferase SETMAR n=1 Tax=Eumeta variegata TaxID=151549 RepID=A0A4C1TAE9_EUMVA|nr:hypothetical protein EVAR_92970_1 [Eumeta japonica]